MLVSVRCGCCNLPLGLEGQERTRSHLNRAVECVAQFPVLPAPAGSVTRSVLSVSAPRRHETEGGENLFELSPFAPRGCTASQRLGRSMLVEELTQDLGQTHACARCTSPQPPHVAVGQTHCDQLALRVGCGTSTRHCGSVIQNPPAPRQVRCLGLVAHLRGFRVALWNGS